MPDTSGEALTSMISETAARLFADLEKNALAAIPRHPGDGAIAWDGTIWDAVEDMGFPLALLTEEAGGFDLDPVAALGLVRQAAGAVVSLPLGETMLAQYVLAHAGLATVTGPVALVTGLTITADGAGWRVQGTAPDVAWGRALQGLVAVDPAGRIARLDGNVWSATQGQNIAGEPRDALRVDLYLGPDQVVQTALTPDLVQGFGALIRAQSLAGALERVLDQTIGYANDRVQFGRPLARFQAIQHNIAIMATNTAAARAGADMAAAALPHAYTDAALFLRNVAAAKLRAGEAAGLCAALAHQIHGAIGVTREYALHPLTTRLWAWRDEYGAERAWADALGAQVLQRGHQGVWPCLTTTEEAQI